MRFLTASASALFVVALAPDSRMQAAGSCQALSALALPNATITLAQAVEAGAVHAAGARRSRSRPARCRRSAASPRR